MHIIDARCFSGSEIELTPVKNALSPSRADTLSTNETHERRTLTIGTVYNIVPQNIGDTSIKDAY